MSLSRFLTAVGLLVVAVLLLATNSGAAPQLSFSNQTGAAGLNVEHKLPSAGTEPIAMMMGGMAVGDFNNDGWEDLFVIGGGGRADSLFINQKNGTFLDKAQEAGLAELHVGSGAAVADYNGDGRLDIYVTSLGPVGNHGPGHHKLYRNNGDGTFTDRAQAAGVNQTSPEVADGFGATFGDYDGDGDLDLFVAGWKDDLTDKVAGMRAGKGLGNRLFRNNGNGTFSDVTASSGIVDDGIRGFSPCFTDMDGDRDSDLLLVADFGTTKYYSNEGGGQFKLHKEYASRLPFSGMGLATGDLNHDGLQDFYVSDIYDDDGNGRGNGGNLLYINQGDHKYDEIAVAAGVFDGAWGWGTVLADMNHDGWLDIAETNGWPLPAYSSEHSRIWVNRGDNQFDEQAQSLGIDHRLLGLGMVHFDYDNDGDQDLAISASNSALNLFRNELTPGGTGWLSVQLDTSNRPDFPPNGIGSRIQVSVDGATYHDWINACPSYLSQSELSAHFGLGTVSKIDAVSVFWPDGSVSRLTDQALNQTLTISAPDPNPLCDGLCALFMPVLQSLPTSLASEQP